MHATSSFQVASHTATIELAQVHSNSEATDKDLPDMLSLVMGRVNSSKHQLTPLQSLDIPVQPEAEDGLLHDALSQHVLEGRHSACD